MNSFTIIQTPTVQSGPRHGGPTMDRRFKVYINDMLFARYTEGEAAVQWARGAYFDRWLDAYVKQYERVIMCKVNRVDHSTETFKAVYADPAKTCEHDWRSTDNWLIDRCSKCGEERA